MLPGCGSEQKPEGLEEAEFVPMRANLARVSYADEEAAIDFHLFSTHDVADALKGAQKHTEVDVAPILRVLVSTSLLLNLLERCSALLKKEGSS